MLYIYFFNLKNIYTTWLTTTDTAQASTPSPLAFAQLTRPVHAFLYPETRATPAQHNSATKSCTNLHLGSIAITLTFSSACSPELLHDCREMNCAPVRFIMLMTLSCYFPNCPACSPCYPTTHYLTMYMCFCL